jgi:hypothetical protein
MSVVQYASIEAQRHCKEHKTTYLAVVVIYDRKMFIRWSAQKSFKIVIYNCKEHFYLQCTVQL